MTLKILNNYCGIGGNRKTNNNEGKKMSLTWTERYRLKQLQRRITKWENRQPLIKRWLKEWRKQAKKLMNKDANNIPNQR